MKYKPAKKDLIAYLYGELNESDQKKIESALDEDPESKKKFEELKDTKKLLKKLKDEDIEAPLVLIDKQTQIPALNNKQTHPFKIIGAVAAAISIILMVGWLVGLNVSYTNSAFTIAFKDQTPKGDTQNKQQILDEKQLEAYFDESISQYVNYKDQNIAARLASLEDELKKIDARANYGKIVKNDLSEQDRIKVATIAKKISDEKTQILISFMENAQIQQKKSIETMFESFTSFLQKQRMEDLQQIQMNFKALQQDVDLKKLHTDEILARIITNENSKNY